MKFISRFNNLFKSTIGVGMLALSAVPILANAAISLSSGSTNFGHVNLGSLTGVKQTLSFAVAGSNVSNVSAYVAGASGQDFTIVSGAGTTCINGATSNCTIEVQFLPTKAGLRNGVVLINYNDGSAKTLTIPIQGFADAPIAVLAQAVGSIFDTTGCSVTQPFQTVVDGSGNVYATSYQGSYVCKYSPNGGSGSRVSIPALPSPSAINSPTGLAIDASGNLYVSDYNNSRLVRIFPGGASQVIALTGISSALSFPTALAVGPNGNLYINDYGSGRIVVVDGSSLATGAGTATASVLNLGGYVLGSDNSTGIAVDSLGNVYFTDQNTNPGRLLKVASGGGAPSVVNMGTFTLNAPLGVAVDGMDNIFVVDSGNQRILQINRSGNVSQVVTSGISLGQFVFGVMPYPSGNLLVSDFSNNRLITVNRQLSTHSFGSLGVGSTSTVWANTLYNLGTADLTFAIPGSGSNPSISSSDFALDSTATTCPVTLSGAGGSSTLLAGSSCNLGVTFTPQAGGARSANMVVTDDTQNISGSIQQLSLSGTGSQLNGACGSAANVAVSLIPTANLCSAGAPSAVTTGSNQYTWSCAGSGGGTTASCRANWLTTATGQAQAALSAPSPGSNNNWVLASASFSSPPTPPANTTLPYGMANFTLNGGTLGTSANVTITYTSAIPAGAVYMKYGKSPDGFNCSGAACSSNHWYQLPSSNVAFSQDRMSVTLTITDGGVGDDDLTPNSLIVDPGGPAIIASPDVAIPTLSDWCLIVLTGLLGAFAAASLCRRQQLT